MRRLLIDMDVEPLLQELQCRREPADPAADDCYFHGNSFGARASSAQDARGLEQEQQRSDKGDRIRATQPKIVSKLMLNGVVLDMLLPFDFAIHDNKSEPRAAASTDRTMQLQGRFRAR